VTKKKKKKKDSMCTACFDLRNVGEDENGRKFKMAYLCNSASCSIATPTAFQPSVKLLLKKKGKGKNKTMQTQ
jgi:hypothetical protein